MMIVCLLLSCRTTTDDQTRIAQDIFLKLDENKYITNASVEQMYCGECKRFLADRFIEGTCPQPDCKFDDARGDQCDKVSFQTALPFYSLCFVYYLFCSCGGWSWWMMNMSLCVIVW